jgi:hypothetical protein
MVVYLCTDEAKDVNGQLFHAERSLIHTYRYGEEAKAIYKYTDGGMFTVDELIETVPASLMNGIPNASPAEEA